ncbi:LysE family translocator [Streptosporangium sp. NPDC004379]|uniref:LysE family translocator n=1 Tax=Streptosporangium sp. NPDC004379 TaxID=3366189 RepID=UPI0036804215
MFLLAFIGSCFVVAMVPGASTAIILRQTLRAGRARGLAAAVGNETGILLWALAAAFGLSALVVASEVAYDVMRAAGAAVLLLMGAQSLWNARRRREGRDGGGGGEGPVGESGGGLRRSYLLGLSTCLANPKAAVFAMSFLPQFVPYGADVPLTLTMLAVVWVLVDTVWYGLFIWMVGRARLVFGRPAVRRRLEALSGVVLIGFGLRLVTESR